MDVRLTRADLKWRDFLPEWEGDPITALFCLAFYYFICFVLTAYLLDPIGWMALELDHPLSHELRHQLLLVMPPLLLVGFWMLILSADGLSRARRRKRESLVLENARAREAAEAARAAAAPVPEPEPPPVRRPPPPPREVESRHPPEEENDPLEWNCFVSPPVNAGPDWEPEPRKRGPVAPKPSAPAAREALGPGLTEQQWHALSDAKELLRHAIPRIPLRHTCLVLSQLAEVLWLDWNRKLPKDWRPALCLSVLRAWCFGQATLADIDAAREEARVASLRVTPGRSRLASPYPAFAAVNAIRYAALYPGFERVAQVSCEPAMGVVGAFITARAHEDAKARAAVEAYEWGQRQAAPLSRLYGELADRTQEKRQLAVRRRVSGYLADLIRQYVPYPSRPSMGWQVRGAIVCAGDAVLTLDGWRIVQAVQVPTKPRYPRGGWN